MDEAAETVNGDSLTTLLSQLISTASPKPTGRV